MLATNLIKISSVLYMNTAYFFALLYTIGINIMY